MTTPSIAEVEARLREGQGAWNHSPGCGCDCTICQAIRLLAAVRPLLEEYRLTVPTGASRRTLDALLAQPTQPTEMKP